ncbi:hypothetical protein ACFLVW_00610 [Chloroflexota bacterium]
MIKQISVFSLPEGTDPEELWKYHTQVHALDVKNAGGSLLKKYVLNRVIKVTHGEPKFWGVVELWFENEETHKEFNERTRETKVANGKAMIEDFTSRVVGRFGAVVEEKEITL